MRVWRLGAPGFEESAVDMGRVSFFGLWIRRSATGTGSPAPRKYWGNATRVMGARGADTVSCDGERAREQWHAWGEHRRLSFSKRRKYSTLRVKVDEPDLTRHSILIVQALNWRGLFNRNWTATRTEELTVCTSTTVPAVPWPTCAHIAKLYYPRKVA